MIGVLSKFILQGSGDQTSMGSGLVAVSDRIRGN